LVAKKTFDVSNMKYDITPFLLLIYFENI